MWVPKEDTQSGMRFWLACLQGLTVVVGITTAVWTFYHQSKAETARAAELDRTAREQLQAVRRELQRPYREKQLNLYLDAARVLAHLAVTPDIEREKTEARFWELYWGELAFVESTVANEPSDGSKPSVERLMVRFCTAYFDTARCSRAGGAAKTRPGVGEDAAIEMSRGASREIREQWERLGSPTTD